MEVRIAADNATVLRFERPVDAVRTKPLNGGQDRFEPLGVAGRSVTLIPRSVVREAERLLLSVTLEDGTVLLLALVVVGLEEADGQVDVFANPFTQGALLAALAQADADHSLLQQKLSEVMLEHDRCKRDENSPDALLAALMLDERTARHFRPRRAQSFDELAGLVVTLDTYRIAGRTVLVVKVRNLDPVRPWSLQRATFTDAVTGEQRDFAIRMRPSLIQPGGSGRLVFVLETPDPKLAPRLLLQLLAREDLERSLCLSKLSF